MTSTIECLVKHNIENLEFLIFNKEQLLRKYLVTWAAEYGHYEHLKSFIENKFQLNSFDTSKASENGNYECLKLLLDNNVPIDSSAVYYASINGHSECVKLLLKNNAPTVLPIYRLNIYMVKYEKYLYHYLKKTPITRITLKKSSNEVKNWTVKAYLCLQKQGMLDEMIFDIFSFMKIIDVMFVV